MTRYRRFFALVVMMSIGAMAIAQVSYPNQKLIEKGDFEKAANKIEKSLAEDPSALDYYAAYVLYGATTGPYANLDRAYNQLRECQTTMERQDEKGKEKLANKGLTEQQLASDFGLLCSRALSAAEATNTIVGYNHFLTLYSGHASASQKERATMKRNHLAFLNARQQNTLEAYEQFINTYTDAKDREEAITIRDQIAFNVARATGTIEGYEYFLQNYALAKEVPFATKSRDSLAFVQVVREGTVEAYETFLSRYPKAFEFSQAVKSRDSIAYAKTEKEGRIEAYEMFISRYPNATQIPRAIKARDYLAYAKAQKADDIPAYEHFLKQYPNASQTPQAKERLYKLAFDVAQERNTPAAFREYLAKYPESPYAEQVNAKVEASKQDSLTQHYLYYTREGNWTDYRYYISNYPNNTNQVAMAKQQICRLGQKTHNLELLDYAVRNLSGDVHDTLEEVLLNIYLDEYQSNGYSFINKYEGLASEQCIDKARRVVSMDLSSKKPIENLQDIGNSWLLHSYMMNMIKDDVEAKRWKAAQTKLDAIKDQVGQYPIFQALYATISAPAEYDIRVTKLGPNINTNKDEYVPIISADDRELFFCGRYREDNLGGEDIFVSSRKTNGPWGKAKILNEINDSYNNEAVTSISPDGNILFVFCSGNLYTSEKTAEGWSELEKLPSSINISSWQSDAILTSDGQHILFTAQKKTDHEVGSSRNIFVSHRTSYGGWSTPESLGPTINTAGTDRSPFIHPDMHTLYFVSDRHSSLGNQDVFVSHRLSDSSWTEWSEPVNLGKEINTPNREWAYQISTDGKTAYFAKEVNGNQDIYSLNLPPRMRPNYVATIEGKLIGKDNKPIVANIRWEDLETQQFIGQIKSNPADGSYFIVLPLGKNYGYYVDNEEYFPLSNNLDLRKEEKAITIEGDIKTITIKEMIEEGIAVPMNNLFFDTGKWNLKAESRNELKRVASIINKQNVKVEISGHTDDVGTDENNQELSEKRAQSVRQYLIDHCGCQADKLIAVGYGKTRPVVPNDSEKNRKLNRRVEMRFVE